jgi:hypothetical protein
LVSILIKPDGDLDLSHPIRYITVIPDDHPALEVGKLGNRQVSIMVGGEVTIIPYHIWRLINSFVEET